MSRTVGLTFPNDELAVSDIIDENGDFCFDKMTVQELKEFADDNNIDIGTASKKADIIKAIVAAGDTEV